MIWLRNATRNIWTNVSIFAQAETATALLALGAHSSNKQFDQQVLRYFFGLHLQPRYQVSLTLVLPKHFKPMLRF